MASQRTSRRVRTDVARAKPVEFCVPNTLSTKGKACAVLQFKEWVTLLR